MTFLNPLILLGMVAAAIPLLIHLFNFRRPRRVDFSSLVFLRELSRSTMQRVRIRQYLLLALRILAIACLVLAFARPTYQGRMAARLGGRIGTSAVVIVDNSLSMTLRGAQGAYIEQARRIATGIVGQMGRTDEVFILTTADTTGPSEAYLGREAAIDAVTRVTPAAGGLSLPAAISRAGYLLERAQQPNREIYLISDLQASALQDSTPVSVPPDVHVTLVPVRGASAPANIGIAGVEIVDRIVEQGRPVRIKATLKNYGRRPVQSHVVMLFLDGKAVGQATIDIPAGQSREVLLTGTPERRGRLSGEIRSESDAFAYDDKRFFVLSIPEVRRILLVDGGVGSNYVALALSADVNQGSALFDVHRMPASALASTPPAGYQAVILAGLDRIGAAETESMVRYVQQGGGVLFYPGNQSGDYRPFLAAIGAGSHAGYSGARGGNALTRLTRAETSHPLFEGMFEAGSAGAAIEQAGIYYRMDYRSGTGNEQMILELGDGYPMMTDVALGRGHTLVVTVAPDPSWTDLPVRGLFVPLMIRSMYYLTADSSAKGPEVVTGRPEDLLLARVQGGSSVRLRAAAGTETALDARVAPGGLAVSVDPAGLSPGVYDLAVDGRVQEKIAVNPDHRESDPAALAPDDVVRALARAGGVQADVLDLRNPDAPTAAKAILQERAGVEIWNVLLLFALIFLVMEMLVASRWKPEATPA